MEPRHQNDLRNLSLRSQLRFLIYLYWLKAKERASWLRSPRRRIHWIGSHGRPRRLERTFFMVVMFAAMLTLDAHQYIVWALAWGGGASLFVIILTLYKLVQRITTDPWNNSELQ